MSLDHEISLLLIFCNDLRCFDCESKFVPVRSSTLGAVHKCQHFHECTNHIRLGRKGVCENQHFFHTLLTFWPDFYYFHRDIWHSKMLMCTLFGGGGLRKCMVCTLMKMLTFMNSPLHIRSNDLPVVVRWSSMRMSSDANETCDVPLFCRELGGVAL